MAARPRIKKRANWPANLHEPRAGYYTFRDPRDGSTHVIGRVPLAQAIFEVHQANAKVAASTQKVALADRINVSTETVDELLAKMPTEGFKKSSLYSHRTIDKKISAALGKIRCADLTTKPIADLIEGIHKEGKHRMSQMVRSRLVKVCKRGIALGWMTTNPAEVTENPKSKVRRSRLTLETFNAILAKAPEVQPWLANAMLLALVSGQDRSTVARWMRSNIDNDMAVVRRTKTEVRIAIPLDIRMDAVGLSLREVIARCKASGVVSQYLIHHVRNGAKVKRGDPVSIGAVSVAFANARRLAGIPEAGAPTFHEIRSLSKRTYQEQGNVDTKALLGHLSDDAANLYADPRGIAPIKVSIR